MTIICYQVLSSGWLWSSDRSSRPEVSCKKGVLRNFAKFTGKHLCQSPFFNKFCEISKNTFFTERFSSTFSVSIYSLILSDFPLTSFHLDEAALLFRGFILLCVHLSKNITKCLLFI